MLSIVRLRMVSHFWWEKNVADQKLKDMLEKHRANIHFFRSRNHHRMISCFGGTKDQV